MTTFLGDDVRLTVRQPEPPRVGLEVEALAAPRVTVMPLRGPSGIAGILEHDQDPPPGTPENTVFLRLPAP